MKNKILVFLVRGIGILINFTLSILLARLYGPNISGEYYLYFNIRILLGTLSFFGFSYTIVHYLSKYFQSKDYEKIIRIVIFSILIIIIISIFLIIISALYITSIKNTRIEKILFYIILLSIIPNNTILLLSEVYKANEKFELSIFVSNILTNLIFAIILIINNCINIKKILIYELICIIINCLINLIIVIKYIYKNKIHFKIIHKKRDFDLKNILKGFLQENITLYLVSISNIILNVFDNIIIGTMISTYKLGIFNISVKVTAIASIVLTTFNTILGQKFAINTDNAEKLKGLFIKYLRILFLIGAVYFIFIQIINNFIPQIFGIAFMESKKYIFILSIGQFITIASGPSAYFLVMTGEAKIYSKIIILTAIINIVISYCGVKIFDVYGILYSNLIINCIKNIWPLIFILKKYKIKIKDIIRN
jgi:O-antigen/teichoic acid export membrane protein